MIWIGIVGNAKTMDSLQQWLSRCGGGLPAKNSRQPNLSPTFSGSHEDSPFHSRFEVDVANW
ncbi:MAG: hypothetical protein ACREC0_14095 [Methylocella sp.]